MSHCANCRNNPFQCEVGGCRPNFLRLGPSQCVCPQGYRINTSVSPNSCEQCLVQYCVDCTGNNSQCETTGCLPTFLRPNPTECKCQDGHIVNNNTNPVTCAPQCVCRKSDNSCMASCPSNFVPSADPSHFLENQAFTFCIEQQYSQIHTQNRTYRVKFSDPPPVLMQPKSFEDLATLLTVEILGYTENDEYTKTLIYNN